MEELDYITSFLLKRSVEPLPKAELESWTTYRVLARLKVLRACMEWIDDRDIFPREVAQVQGRILLKGTPEWNTAWSDVKAVIASREHIPRPQRYSSKRRGRVAKSGTRRVTKRSTQSLGQT